MTQLLTKSLEDKAKRITVDLFKHGMIKTWYRDKPAGWTLVSGMWSPFYIQLRTLCSHPLLLQDIGEAFCQLIREQAADTTRILGIAMSGIPIAVATSLWCKLPAAFTRKIDMTSSSKRGPATYGEHSIIEGELLENDRIVLVDDVVTKFDTKLEALFLANKEIEMRGFGNVRCTAVLVVIDREQGAEIAAATCHLKILSLIRFRSQALRWLSSYMTPLEYEVITDYLSNPAKFQHPEVIQRLAKKAEIA